jgi:hypothetical protein
MIKPSTAFPSRAKDSARHPGERGASGAHLVLVLTPTPRFGRECLSPGCRCPDVGSTVVARRESPTFRSAQWERPHECGTPFRYAETLNKAIVCARLEPVPDRGIASKWQRCDLSGDGQATAISVDEGEPILLATEGLRRQLGGLRALGIGAADRPHLAVSVYT